MPEAGRQVSVTRESVVTGCGDGAVDATSGTIGIEAFRLSVTTYRIRPIGPWPAGRFLRIVALSDIHACEPWMSARRIAGIVEMANGLQGDLILLLGDYVAGMRAVRRCLDATEWGPILGRLAAPLGVYAILGNHDWRTDPMAVRRGSGPTLAGEALEQAGIRVLENEALPLPGAGPAIWIAGLGDQIAFLSSWKRFVLRRPGADDLPGTLSQIPDGAPTILLAHEPDIFPKVPARVTLTLSGHTHGGQLRAFGFSPLVPSRYGNRYAYGHVREQSDLVVSAGLGMSLAPIRLGVPPEITVVELVGEACT